MCSQIRTSHWLLILNNFEKGRIFLFVSCVCCAKKIEKIYYKRYEKNRRIFLKFSLKINRLFARGLSMILPWFISWWGIKTRDFLTGSEASGKSSSTNISLGLLFLLVFLLLLFLLFILGKISLINVPSNTSKNSNDDKPNQISQISFTRRACFITPVSNTFDLSWWRVWRASISSTISTRVSWFASWFAFWSGGCWGLVWIVSGWGSGSSSTSSWWGWGWKRRVK